MKKQSKNNCNINHETIALEKAVERNANLNIALLQLGVTFFLMSNSVYDAIESFFNKELKISQAKFSILMYLSTESTSGLVQSEIVRRWKVSPAAISNRIDGLERSGLVKRVKSIKDNREKIITITPEGQKFFDYALVEYSRWLVQTIGTMESNTRENFTSQAEQIRNLFLMKEHFS